MHNRFRCNFIYIIYVIIVVVNTVYICLWMCAVTMFRFLRHPLLFVRTLFPPLNGCCRVHVRVCVKKHLISFTNIHHTMEMSHNNNKDYTHLAQPQHSIRLTQHIYAVYSNFQLFYVQHLHFSIKY